MTHLSFGIRTRQVLEEIGSAHEDSSGDATTVSSRRRPWELRPVIHAAFKARVEENQNKKQPDTWSSRLRDVGIRDSMEGAIEMRLEKSVMDIESDNENKRAYRSLLATLRDRFENTLSRKRTTILTCGRSSKHTREPLLCVSHLVPRILCVVLV